MHHPQAVVVHRQPRASSLRASTDQAKEMRLQRIIMHNTLNAIKKQAGVMQSQLKFSRNKERARISILFPDESEQMTVQIDQPYAMGSVRLNLEKSWHHPSIQNCCRV